MTSPGQVSVCAVILAGGRSERMGRDKSRLRLGRHTLAGVLQRTCRAAGFITRVIRKDDVPRCGPLGGIITALRRTTHAGVLFLSCDMPFVETRLLRHFLAAAQTRHPARAVFAADASGVGFPFLIWRPQLSTVERQRVRGTFSLQALAAELKARRLRLPASLQAQRFNVNSPADWEEARRRFAALTESHGPSR